MTMFQHAFLGNAILLFLWVVWLQQYYYTSKNKKDIDKEVNHWIDRFFQN